jgi:hypothetical protein
MNINHQMLLDLVEAYQIETDKFRAGNKTAGTRARKALSEISKLCKIIRGDIQQEKNTS